MPKAVEDKLKRAARRKGLTGRRFDAYVYGTMQELGLLRRSAHHKGGK
jgi:hypothetical protein